MEIEPFYFKSIGYVQAKLSSECLKQIKDEAKYILENSDKFKKHNKHLAGNLEKEYSMQHSKKILMPYLTSLAREFQNYSENNNDEKVYPEWFVRDIWINYQKKYEYNPLHNHSGDLSFVLWVQIPYNLENELSHPNCIDSGNPQNSLFKFVCDFMGSLVTTELYVDKSWEGTIVMFPSSLNHAVNPFYTSDDYRISISGNLVIAPPKNIFSYK